MSIKNLGRVVGADGQDGRGITSILKTATAGLVDTYTITYTDGTTSTFTVTNGADGQNGQDGQNGINGIDGKDGKDGKDGTNGTDGRGITSILKTGTSGLVDTYTITYTDNTTSTFTVTNGEGGSEVSVYDLSFEGEEPSQSQLEEIYTQKPDIINLIQDTTVVFYRSNIEERKIKYATIDDSGEGANALVIKIENSDNNFYIELFDYPISGGGSGGETTDVRINNVSITSYGVANILTNSEYNSTSNKIATMRDIPDTSSFITKSVDDLDNYTLTRNLGDLATKDTVDYDTMVTNKPTIPTALADLSGDSTHRVVTDTEKTTWNAKSDFSGSYNDLTDKPTIPSEVTETTVSNWGFTKNTGTYSKPSGGIPKTDLAEAVQTSLGKADTAIQEHQSLSNYYTKSEVDGKVSSVYKYQGTVSTYADLPDTDLTVGYVYNITTADKTHHIKAGDNVAWTGSGWDVLGGNVDLSGYQTLIDSSNKLSSDLVDDTNNTNKFVTASEKSTWNAKSDFSGSYNDLTDKPTIPSEVTETTVSNWGFTKNTGTYSKPSGGIPESDLSSAVQAKLNSETADVILDSNLVGKKLSLIGDSITTYQGWLPSGNVTRYPRGAITNVEQTWWKKLLNATGMVIGQNCAWDGSTCSGLSTSTTNAYAGCSDKRISQLGLNGTPDIIICYIGINDWGATYNKNKTQYGGSFVDGAFVPVGDYTGETALPSGELKTFSEAYGCMIGKIQNQYPNAKIYCCTLPQTNGKATYNYDADGVFPSVNRNGVSIADYNDCIRMLANNFGVEIIEFAKCGINWGNMTTYMEDGLHPRPDGMTLLADTAKAKLYNDFGVSVHGGSPTPTTEYTITNNLTHVTTNNNATSIAENASYIATLTAESTYNLQSVTVEMGGTDITATAYNNGTITIVNVTGNLVITATATAQASYSVTNNLTNVTTSNNTASVIENSSYSATLSPAAHYTMGTVTVTMGNTDITSTAYNNGVISIASVTGDLVITATGNAITYTITNTLTNVTNNNSDTSIIEGSVYTATLTPDSSYRISSVSISMGGTDITSTSYDNGSISIASVTGNIVITASAELVPTYTVTNNLTNATNSNSDTTVTEGSSYTGTITADSGYEIDTATITMGGVDITSTAYSNGTINIASVTGNIVITVTTQEIQLIWYTDFAQTSTSSFVASSKGWALDETTYANIYGKPINKISFVATASSGAMDFCIAPSKNAQTGFTNVQTINWNSSNKSGNIVTIDIPEFTLADGTYLCVYVNTTPASGAACYASGGNAGQFYSYVGNTTKSTWGSKGTYSIQMNLGYGPSSN